jgi:uncharacterized repeat protein (TIGR03803 family)
VFEIAKSVEKSLFSFCGDGNGRTTGQNPQSDLMIDATGNLYGTTPGGGTNQDGVVFEMLPGLAGTWTEAILYAFCSMTNCPDGKRPEAALAMDSQGNLYGTTAGGGAHGFGVVFKLSPVGSGWLETVLHSFTGGIDGGNPVAGLAIDSQGNLYGTATVGGDLSKCFGIGCGTVFQIRP